MPDPVTPIDTPDEPLPDWPDDPAEMTLMMLGEQASALHAMFFDLRDYSAETFRKQSPQAAQAYIRLALRAQGNCRSALDSIGRADRVHRAVGRKDADSEK